MFEQALTLVQRYHEKYVADPEFNSHLLAEVEERLRQLDFLLPRIRELEQKAEAAPLGVQRAMSAHFAAHPPPPGVSAGAVPPVVAEAQEDMWKQIAAVQFEARLLTEAFYYFAFRAVVIFKSLPQLKSFDPVGVRTVRNKLIEHPEKQSHVYVQNFSTGRLEGPVLKGGRPPDQSQHFQDRGLNLNAEEFRDRLEAALNKALGTAIKAAGSFPPS